MRSIQLDLNSSASGSISLKYTLIFHAIFRWILELIMLIAWYSYFENCRWFRKINKLKGHIILIEMLLDYLKYHAWIIPWNKSTYIAYCVSRFSLLFCDFAHLWHTRCGYSIQICCAKEMIVKQVFCLSPSLYTE